MSDPSSLFDDGKAYERLMGRWSRVVGEKFLDWITPEKHLGWIDAFSGRTQMSALIGSSGADAGSA
jgi:hypothetical protein